MRFPVIDVDGCSSVEFVGWSPGRTPGAGPGGGRSLEWDGTDGWDEVWDQDVHRRVVS